MWIYSHLRRSPPAFAELTAHSLGHLSVKRPLYFFKGGPILSWSGDADVASGREGGTTGMGDMRIEEVVELIRESSASSVMDTKVVAIDEGGGAGKSTLAKEIA